MQRILPPFHDSGATEREDARDRSGDRREARKSECGVNAKPVSDEVRQDGSDMTTRQTLRLFIGSFLSRDNQAFYDQVVERLAGESEGRLRPIPRGSAHLTHAFLGEVPREALPDLENALRALRQETSFAIRLGPPEVLRTRRAPRLVLAPVVAGDQRLAALARHVDRLARQVVALAEEKAPKRPYVTLARCRDSADPSQARRVVDLLARSGAGLTGCDDAIERVQVIRSTLTERGPVYEVSAEITLAAT
jgi:2'-5' RNA ligase